MEAYKTQVLTKMTNGRPPHEVDYFDSLFGLCANGASISGPLAVSFFKKSKLELVSKRFFDSYSDWADNSTHNLVAS